MASSFECSFGPVCEGGVSAYRIIAAAAASMLEQGVVRPDAPVRLQDLLRPEVIHDAAVGAEAVRQVVPGGLLAEAFLEASPRMVRPEDRCGSCPLTQLEALLRTPPEGPQLPAS